MGFIWKFLDLENMVQEWEIKYLKYFGTLYMFEFNHNAL